MNGDAFGATTWAMSVGLELVLVWTVNVHDQELAARRLLMGGAGQSWGTG